MVKVSSWLTADQSARLLGIKRETLYAYASRGKVRTQQLGRTKQYLRSDLDRLQARQRARSGHGAVAADALRWGEPVLDSRITNLLPSGPVYRGVPALDLARSASFEAAAEHLWRALPPTAVEPPGAGAEPVDPSPTSPPAPASASPGADRFVAASAWPVPAWPLPPRRLMSVFTPTARPVERLAAVLPLLAMRDPQRMHLGPDATLVVARRVIRLLVACLGLGCGPSHARKALGASSIAAAFLASFGCAERPATLDGVTSALVLCADHGLNPSSFAARVSASAGADLHACLGAALATLSGPRHGGMPARVTALFEEIARPGNAARVVGARLARGDDVPGFGHPLYPEGDPRCGPLIAAARRIAPRARVTAIVESLVETMKLIGGQPPTVDVGLAAMAAALALPPGGATALFAVGRSAGWVAQILEQREGDYVLRPRARYVGP